jgi:hypothetical protein
MLVIAITVMPFDSLITLDHLAAERAKSVLLAQDLLLLGGYGIRHLPNADAQPLPGAAA